MSAAPNRCEEHARKISEMEKRLEKGDAILTTVKRIEIAVCGDEAMGVKGLVSLHGRVESLERDRVWRLGAAAALGFVAGSVPVLIALFKK